LVDIVVRGRNVEVSDRFRARVTEKLAKVERLDHKVQLVDVEMSKELNPRLAERAFKVEVTIRSRGPVVRAEAAAEDKYAALELACGKLESRLRRRADRRSDHHPTHGQPPLEPVLTDLSVDLPADLAAGDADDVDDDPWSAPDLTPPMVREKVHDARPMTLDEALEAMELVGHDFYLFVDAETAQPAVVYRRNRGYDYGVIRLQIATA
jgi:ribosomal subunit interface protein